MGAKKRLSVEDILEAMDIQTKEIEVPEWGGTVLVQSLTKKAQQEARARATKPDPETGDDDIDMNAMEIELFVASVQEPKFGPEHFEQLREKNATAMDRILEVAGTLSGITKEQAASAAKSFRTKREG